MQLYKNEIIFLYKMLMSLKNAIKYLFITRARLL